MFDVWCLITRCSAGSLAKSWRWWMGDIIVFSDVYFLICGENGVRMSMLICLWFNSSVHTSSFSIFSLRMMDKLGWCSLAVAWIAGCFMCRVRSFYTWILFVCFGFMCLLMRTNYVSSIVTVTAPVHKSGNCHTHPSLVWVVRPLLTTRRRHTAGVVGRRRWMKKKDWKG